MGLLGMSFVLVGCGASAAEWYEVSLGRPMPASAAVRADVSNVFPLEGATGMVIDIDPSDAELLVSRPTPLGPWHIGPVTGETGGGMVPGVVGQLEELVDDPGLFDALDGDVLHIAAQERCCSSRDSLPWWNATVAVVDVELGRVYIMTWDY
ncbi:MAG: hypothetical protein AAF467_21980 [Actinomycetota bacterium]